MTTQETQLEMRDLPELESISTGGRANRIVSLTVWLIISVLAGGALAAIVWALVYSFANRHIGYAPAVLVGLAVAIAVAALLRRCRTFDWQWDIDREGIAIHGLFGERHLQWSEILQIEGKPYSSGRIYHIRTAAGKFAIAEMSQPNGETIGASLYQHLRRYGKADESLLTPGARTFWIPIPDEVPKEMDWHHPNPPNWSILMGVTVFIVLAGVLVYLFGSEMRLGKLLSSAHQWIVPIAVGAYKKLRDRLIVARSVAIRNDHVEMRTARSTVYLHWTEVNYVHWDNTRKSLTLGKGQFSSVAVIPYLENDQNSAAAMLAIIRQLRLAHHTPPVAIPTQLLPRLYEGAAAPAAKYFGDEAAEIRIYNRNAAWVPVLLSLLPMALVVWMLSDLRRLMDSPTWLISLLLAPVVGIGIGGVLLILSRTTYRADASGITIKTMLKRRFIDWREITSYTVASGNGALSKRTLRDSSGQVIMATPYLDETKPHIERFISLLDARLAHVRQQHLPTLTR